MPILASNIISLVESALDAEGSDYYTDQQDYIPAINLGQKFLVSLINSHLGGKKFAEEYYRELIKSRVFQTSQYSRIDVTPINEKVWTMLSVTVEPTLNTPFIPSNVIGGLSVPRPDLFMVSGGKACQRLTVEEWAINIDNPFEAGYNLEPNSINKDYAYLTHLDYNFIPPFSPALASPNEINIRPFIPQLPVVIVFVKIPSTITAATDNLDFPESFTDIMVQATLRQIAFKQGDRTTISTLSNQDMIMMLQSTF